MGQVTCTIVYKELNCRDLVLPDNIPVHLLTNSIALSLGLPTGERLAYELYNQEKIEFSRIPSTRTLQQAYVTCGATLKLALEVEDEENTGYLFVDKNTKFKLHDNNVLGREFRNNPVDIDLTQFDLNKVVSRRHAIITRLNDRYLIKDAESKNGTYVNHEKIPIGRSVALQSKDEIYFGTAGKGVRLIFVIR